MNGQSGQVLMMGASGRRRWVNLTCFPSSKTMRAEGSPQMEHSKRALGAAAVVVEGGEGDDGCGGGSGDGTSTFVLGA